MLMVCADEMQFHLDVQEEQLRAGTMPGSGSFGIEPEDRYGTLVTIEGDKMHPEKHSTVQPQTYTEFYRRLGKALLGQGDVPVKAEGAMQVIHLIELAKESSKEARTIDV